jgi:hypothetical protein
MELCIGTCRVVTPMQLLSKAKSRLCSRTSKCSAWGSLLTVLTTSFRPSKSRKREGYMTSFIHVFNTNKVPRVVLVFLLVGTHLGIKRESLSHTRQVRPNQQVQPAQLVWPTLHPATIRVPTITTSTNTLWMDRIHRGYVGLIKGCERKHFDPWAHFCMHPTATLKQSRAFPTSGGASHDFE